MPIGMAGSCSAGVDLDDGQVRLRVAGHQRGDVVAGVGQRHLDLADAVDDVEVGEDVASRVDDHPGAHAVDPAATLAGRGLGGRGNDGLLASDIDHGGPDLLNRLHGRRTSVVRRRPVSRAVSGSRPTASATLPSRSGAMVSAVGRHGEPIAGGGSVGSISGRTRGLRPLVTLLLDRI